MFIDMTMTTAPLQQQIDAFNAQARSQFPADMLQDLARPVAQLITSGAADKALAEGAQAPDFTLPDAFGRLVTLSRLLEQGPVVLSFYWGGWCPYCTLELRAYQQALAELQESGASVVAISPQTPEHSRATVEGNALTFTVLSDVGNVVARQFGLAYALEKTVRRAYRRMGADLPAFNGDDSWELPMPGTFIIDQTGTVLLAFVDPDFTHRLDPSAIVARLLARLAAAAIEKTEQLTRIRQVATLEERRRIARELHDSVTQTLCGLQAVAQAALDNWETQPQQARAAVETILYLARAASVEMRTLLVALRDEALQAEGLAGALAKHVALLRHQSALAVELDVAHQMHELRLPSQHEEALYRLVQEALANVIKHARARRACVTLAVQVGGVRVHVEDDGVGFPPDGPAFDAFGLRGMRERVQALGGTLQVGNGPSGGAYVAADLPLPVPIDFPVAGAQGVAALTTAAQGA
jgi:signal transduction histidine kinase